MHIPDGFLTPTVAGGAATLSAAALAVSYHRLKFNVQDRTAPLLGVTAAGVFAAQMINFPIPGGTSGHLLGGVLTAALVGPWAGLWAMACVLIVQCFLFGDGGLLALGANVFNMGVVGCLLGYAVYAPLRRSIGGPAGTVSAAVVAAWVTTVVAAMTCSWQLALSGAHAVGRTMGLMVGVHSLIGVGEALLTGLVVSSLLRVRPELFEPTNENVPDRTFQAAAAGFAFALVLAVFVSPWASQLPDGLDHVAQTLGFADRGYAATPAMMKEYKFPGLPPGWATSVAGLIGTVAVLFIAWALGRSFRVSGGLSPHVV